MTPFLFSDEHISNALSVCIAKYIYGFILPNNCYVLLDK